MRKQAWVTCPKSYNWLGVCSNSSCCLQKVKVVWGRTIFVWEPESCKQEQARSLCNISLQVSNRHFELLPKHAQDKPVSFPSFPPLLLSHSVLAAWTISLGNTERLSCALNLELSGLSAPWWMESWANAVVCLVWAKLCLITGHWHSWKVSNCHLLIGCCTVVKCVEGLSQLLTFLLPL